MNKRILFVLVVLVFAAWAILQVTDRTPATDPVRTAAIPAQPVSSSEEPAPADQTQPVAEAETAHGPITLPPSVDSLSLSKPAQEIQNLLSSGKTEDKEKALSTLLPALLKDDLQTASQLAEALEPWAWRENVLHAVAREWAVQNPANATAWASHLTRPGERMTVLNDICVEVAQTNATEAMKIVRENQLDVQASPVVQNIVQIWAGQDLAAAKEWALQQPTAEKRDEAIQRVAAAQAETAPAEAAQFVSTEMSSGSAQEEAAMSVLHKWLLRDPEAAKAWVKLFPSSSFRERAEAEIAGQARYAKPLAGS